MQTLQLDSHYKHGKRYMGISEENQYFRRIKSPYNHIIVLISTTIIIRFLGTFFVNLVNKLLVHIKLIGLKLQKYSN